MTNVETLDYRLLRLPQVLQIIPVSKAAFYKGIAANKYPKPIKLSSRLSVWKLADIRDCITLMDANQKEGRPN